MMSWGESGLDATQFGAPSPFYSATGQAKARRRWLSGESTPEDGIFQGS